MSNSYKIVAPIEARMTSTRLPGKVMMEVGGKPLLQILIERLQQSETIDQIVMATTTNPQDDPIAEMCDRIGVACFRGSELNVLDRVCGAARITDADIIVEITGDNCLIDHRTVDQMIRIFLENYPTHRYVSDVGDDENSLPWGFDAKVFAAKDLYEINDNNPDNMDKEHVSWRFYQPEVHEKYNPLIVKYDGAIHRPELCVVLDYQEDYDLMKACYEDLYPQNPQFGVLDIIQWLDKHPDIRDAAIAVRS